MAKRKRPVMARPKGGKGGGKPPPSHGKGGGKPPQGDAPDTPKPHPPDGGGGGGGDKVKDPPPIAVQAKLTSLAEMLANTMPKDHWK